MSIAGLISGLGNPGGQYEKTRHNAGFRVLDRLARRWGCGFKTEDRFKARIGRTEYGGRSWILCQPRTYMNASGEALGAVVRFFKVPLDRFLVSVDDADLPLGTIRMRPRGRSGGHHGLESVERHVGGAGFVRQRIGIGRLPSGQRDIVEWVLGGFDPDELAVVDEVLDRAVAQIELWAASGVEEAMNRYNGTM